MSDEQQSEPPKHFPSSTALVEPRDLPDPAETRIHPWDRLPEETVQEFDAFVVYRDYGPDRSIKKAWISVRPDNRQGINGSWYHYSKRNRWNERALAYDGYFNRIRKAERDKVEREEAAANETSKKHLKANEVFLGMQAFKRAQEILAMPVVKNSFVEERQIGGRDVTIVHKTTMISPSHLFAAVALMREGSNLSRRGLGIKDEKDEGLSVEQFEKLFFKTTGEQVKHLPPGAVPPAPADAAAKPDIHLPSQDADAAAKAAQAGEGTPAATPAPAPYRPPRDRP